MQKNLAKEKGLPYICLDRVRYTKDGKLSKEDFRRELRDIVSKDSWVIEGILRNSQDIIFPRATEIIVLKASRLTCAFRALIRTVRRILNMEESFVKNELDNFFTRDFIVWSVWREYPRYKREIEEALDKTSYNAKLIEREI